MGAAVSRAEQWDHQAGEKTSQAGDGRTVKFKEEEEDEGAEDSAQARGGA